MNKDDSQRDRARKRIHKVLSAELERRFSLTERAINLMAADKRRENAGVALNDSWQLALGTGVWSRMSSIIELAEVPLMRAPGATISRCASA